MLVDGPGEETVNSKMNRLNRRRLVQATASAFALTALGGAPAFAAPNAATRAVPTQAAGSILAARRLVTYYGNPWAGQMGILGELSESGLVQALQNRAAQYQAAGNKPVQPAIHMVVTTAQASPGGDGLYRFRMPASVIGEYAQLAAANSMLFIADVQVGLSTVEDEIAAIQPFLEQPHVHLALDPEFDMWDRG